MKLVLNLKTLESKSAVEIDPEERIRKQTGVIPYRIEDGHIMYMLIGSSHSGKWGLPKGKKEKGMSKKQSALVEAWEEAGLKGKASIKLGSYNYRKGFTGVAQKVTVYAMRVDEVHMEFPEQWRERMWFDFKRAMKRLPKQQRPFLEALHKLLEARLGVA